MGDRGRDDGDGSDQLRKLFVGGLADTTDKEKLREVFEEFGPLEDYVVIMAGDGRSKGFGFIKFQEEKSADEAIKGSPFNIDGKDVMVKRSFPKAAMNNDSNVAARNKKIFVGGLPREVSKEKLREHFSRFGEIEDTVVMMDKETGYSRGFGFVTFTEYDEADKAVIAKHVIQDRKVEVKKAETRETMAQREGRGSREFRSERGPPGRDYGRSDYGGRGGDYGGRGGDYGRDDYSRGRYGGGGGGGGYYGGRAGGYDEYSGGYGGYSSGGPSGYGGGYGGGYDDAYSGGGGGYGGASAGQYGYGGGSYGGGGYGGGYGGSGGGAGGYGGGRSSGAGGAGSSRYRPY